MSDLIDRQAFIENERKLYCEDCDRRKGTKNGKSNVICYEIGEAPCRACWLDDALTDLEDFPTASPWHRVEEEMPDLLQFVVVCNDEGKCVVAQYVGYQTDSLTPWRISYTMYDTDIYDETECGPVCYWMPLPYPPVNKMFTK